MNDDKPSGYYSIDWHVPEKSTMASGIYFYKLSTKDNTIIIKRMIILR